MKNYLSEESFDLTKQLFRKMRTTCLLILVFASSLFAANVNSQVARVSLFIKNSSLIQVLDAIEHQTDYLFVYNRNEIDLNREVNMEVKDQSVATVLSGIFQSTGISYAMEGNNIVLFKMEKDAQQQKSMIGKATSVQKATLKGTIVDKATNEPLIGATIMVKGTTIGTTTDINGKYELANLDPGALTFVISFIGYSSQAKNIVLKANEIITLDIQLSQDMIGLDEVVVTGVVNPKSALESSVAVTSLQPKSIEKMGATSTAELFKSIPGIHSESTGGEGNANISVRGIPISSGGSKYMQLYEDGLPVMQFGDINFGNADIFLRTDQTLARIEAVKGGSASTFASNSPGGIINFISKTGVTEGGTLSASFGLDYNDFRTDFNYGSPIGNGIHFNIGGFYRQGEGPRKVGYDGNLGGQIKANITKEFKNGYVRLCFKHLDDRAASYMPMPVAVTGNAKNPTYKSIAGFDLHNASLQSSEFFSMLNVDNGGNPRTTNISDGMHPVANTFGTEFSFDIGDGWRLNEKSKLSLINGSFRTISPKSIGTADAIAKSVVGSSIYTVSYANGVNAGKALSASELLGLNGNGLLMSLVSYDIDINSFNNFTNDFNVSKKFNKINITAGLYKAYQQIATYWDCNGYTSDVRNQPKLVNIANADGSKYTTGGLVSSGKLGQRKYDMKYNIDAPYANIGIDLDKINIDASIRYDAGTASGYYQGSITKLKDLNGDGKIDLAEQGVVLVDNTNPHSVNYNWGYTSYSIGANYKLDANKAFYARISSGGRANADRLLYSPWILADGTSSKVADMVQQYECGFKYNSPVVALMATPFYAVTNEENQNLTEGTFSIQKYLSYGAEFEATAHIGGLNIATGAIYNHAKIASSLLNPGVVGNTPRRVPDLMYNINPSYHFGKADIGFSLIGTTKVYSQDDNLIVLPAFAYVNAFASYQITKGLILSVNSNNVFNTLGFTEMSSGGYDDTKTNYMRARPITGRTSVLKLAYNF